TRSVHAGRPRDPGHGDIATPIHLSSTYFSRTTQELVDYHEGRRTANFYSRYSNPTVEAAELKIAALEGGERALCFGSGMAAMPDPKQSARSPPSSAAIFSSAASTVGLEYRE
ncbi:MAG TPA: PLP-dependent transferase, partial [Candidatus Limnocylindrales bacterium]|nr:PLP-dependent transferase [Candidatus Limnocylindrales bacterium]